jgi:hypothetical protein
MNLPRQLTVVIVAMASATVAQADPVLIDPSFYSSGTDISNLFDGVTLSTAQGSMEIFDTKVTDPLHLISDIIEPVLSDGTYFAHGGGSIWSAGQCCGRDDVLRIDFDGLATMVSVMFVPDDTDTGILQIYDSSDILLDEAIFRSSSNFDLTLSGDDIAYALATFGDTGQIRIISYEAAIADSDFVAAFTFPGGRIFGHLPAPQINGFDYYFTPVMLDTAILGDGVTIESVEITAFGQNNGAVVNFDWEVHIGPMSFGLPEGQFIQTFVDPIAGYARIAPTQFRFVIGNQLDARSYQFSGQHDFVAGTTTANPYLSLVQAAFTSPMNLTDGLYAQVFLWTADNRNSQIDFSEITLTVRGQMLSVPVVIDIKPGKTPNSINPTSGQKIPVAILTTYTFDASQVDWDTVLFGPNEAAKSHAMGHVKDVDEDGDLDLLLHFNTQETGIVCGDIEATLTGELFSGEPITGTDAINTVPCR